MCDALLQMLQHCVLIKKSVSCRESQILEQLFKSADSMLTALSPTSEYSYHH